MAVSKELQKKIDQSIKLLKVACKGKQVEVAYSGGKDSDVILQLAKEAEIDFVPIYKMTTIDPPGTIQHAKDNGDYDRLRDYWYKGLVSDSTIQNLGPLFFRGGNVLLRVTDKFVKSSKGISVSIAEAVRMWKIVKRWHEDESTFEAYSEKFFTTLSNYGISRYQNDILIAGCHAIAYKEMERAAIELGIEKKEEKTAVAITA